MKTSEMISMNEELILRGYSKKTIRTYLGELAVFQRSFSGMDISKFDEQKLKAYFLFCHTELKLGEATIHSRINALKFYYEKVLKRDRFFIHLPRPKKHLQLPKVISEDKIIEGLLSVENLKHQALLLLAYSAGLRVSEVVNLKIKDIDSQRMIIYIDKSKGKKDRCVQLSSSLLPLLRDYYRTFKPKSWLFEGAKDGQPYSVRSAQLVFKHALPKLDCRSILVSTLYDIVMPRIC